MKRALTPFALFGLVTAALAAAEVGKPAPDFTATDINGQTHKLSDYKGKIVVLESYNLDCPFCRNHYKSGAMQELQRDLAAKGVVWLMVNSVIAKHPSHRTAEAAKKEWDRPEDRRHRLARRQLRRDRQGLRHEDHPAHVRHRPAGHPGLPGRH